MKRRVYAVSPLHTEALRVPGRLLPAGRARPRTSAGGGPALLGSLRAAPTLGERLQPPSSRRLLLLLLFLLPSPAEHAQPGTRIAGSEAGRRDPAPSLAPLLGDSHRPSSPSLTGLFPPAPEDDEAADAAAGAVSAGGALARRPPPLLLRGEEEVGGGGSRGAHAGGKEGAGAIPVGCSRGQDAPQLPGEEVAGGFRDPHPTALPLKFCTGSVPGGVGPFSYPAPGRGALSSAQPRAATTPSAPLPTPRPLFTGGRSRRSSPSSGDRSSAPPGTLSTPRFGPWVPGGGEIGACFVSPMGDRRVLSPVGHAVFPSPPLHKKGSILSPVPERGADGECSGGPWQSFRAGRVLPCESQPRWKKECVCHRVVCVSCLSPGSASMGGMRRASHSTQSETEEFRCPTAAKSRGAASSFSGTRSRVLSNELKPRVNFPEDRVRCCS